MYAILIILQLIINLLFIIWITILERSVNEHTRCLLSLSLHVIKKDKNLKSKFEKFVKETENK